MSDNVIAKEGQKPVLYAFIAMLVFVLLECEFFTFIAFVITLFFLYSFRYKYIDIKAIDKKNIVAPISGKISAIDTKNFKKIIHVDVGLLDSHVLRALETSDVEVSLKRGLNLSLGSLKSNRLNETAIIKSKNLTMKLISSMCNSPLEISDKTSFEKGEKIGVFINGKVIIELDTNMTTDLKIGDKVVTGETVIAKITAN